MALNFYGYREENLMRPNTAVDDRQDAEIAEKADLSVVSAIVESVVSEIDDILDILSGSIDDMSDDIDSINSSITEIRQRIEHFVTKAELMNVSGELSTAISQVESITTSRINDLYDIINGDGGINDKIRSLSGEVESFSYDIEDLIHRVELLEENKADKADIEELIEIISGVSGMAGDITAEIEARIEGDDNLQSLISDEASTREEEDNLIRGMVIELSADTEAGYVALVDMITVETNERISADTAINERIDGIESEIEGLPEEIDALRYAVSDIIEELPSKADKNYVDEKLSEKVDNEDFESLSHLVNDIYEELGEKADTEVVEGLVNGINDTISGIQEDLSDCIEDVDSISGVVDALKEDIENDYLTKEEGDARYPLKSESATKTELEDAVQMFESLEEATRRNLEGQILAERNTRASADSLLEQSISAESYRAYAAEDSLQNITSEISNRVSSLSQTVSDNSTKIGCISELKGVNGSDISGYDDTGNGILDALHREYHTLVSDTYGEASISGLINYIVSLENRIKDLENRL